MMFFKKLRKKIIFTFTSAHGSYYINLNSDEIENKKSIERIIKGAEGLQKGRRTKFLIFHPGFYLKILQKKP